MILFDSHWNPAVDLQAIYRCYRYGQTKSVFAYRFLTEGTMEDKIYSRSVNKSGLAARVIDQKHPERAFTGAELNDILATNTMVCCELWYVLNEFEVCEASQFIFLSFLRHLPPPPPSILSTPQRPLANHSALGGGQRRRIRWILVLRYEQVRQATS